MPDDAQKSDPLDQVPPAPAARPVASLSLRDLESGWRVFRRRSPIIIPVVLGAIAFTLVAVLSLYGIAHVSPYAIWPLLLVFAAIGVLQGAALRYMPDDLSWVIAAGAGFLVFFAAAALAILGLAIGAIVVVVFCVVVAILLRRRVHSVIEGTVHVMLLFGKYNRTLMPGVHFYFPGERCVAVLRTSEAFYTSPRQRVLASFGAEIELAATISYQLVPEEAHRAVLLVDDWEKRLRALLETTVQDVVNELTPDDFVRAGVANVQMAAGGAWPTRLDRINSRLYIKVQYQAVNWGVQVKWVKVHDIAIALPAPEGLGRRSAAPAGHAGVTGAGATSARATVVDGGAGPKAQNIPPTAPAQATAAGQEKASAMAGGPKSLQGLTEAYNAVREKRVTDPATIRGIAGAFEWLAENRQPDQQLPFDPREVAWNLRRYASMLQQHSQQGEQQNGAPAASAEPPDGTNDAGHTIAVETSAESPVVARDAWADTAEFLRAREDDEAEG
jgi:hypothetical protein